MPNPYAFPFAATGLPDAVPLGCQADRPYRLAAPSDRFLPFVLRRALGATSRRLSCATVEDEDGNVVFTLNLDQSQMAERLAYEKFHDQASGADLFLYYGAQVQGMNLPCGKVLRLRIDEFTSAAFTPVASIDQYLLAEWFHPTPLGTVPYGTGLRQRLYIYQGHLQPGAPRTEQETTKDPATGLERVDFLAQVPTASFETEPVPGWIVEALYAATAVGSFSAAEWAGSVLKEVRTTTIGDCLNRLSLSLEHPGLAVVRRACSAALPVLEPEPAGYTVRGWRCGDESDTAPDWQPDLTQFECEQNSLPDWKPDLTQYECETV